MARLVDLESAVDVLGGKIEFEAGEEGREDAILAHLLRTATAETARAHFRGIDLGALVEALDGHTNVTTGEQVTAAEFLDGLPQAGEVYDEIAERFEADTPGRRASAIELALEGLYLARRIAKESDGAETIYG